MSLGRLDHRGRKRGRGSSRVEGGYDVASVVFGGESQDDTPFPSFGLYDGKLRLGITTRPRLGTWRVERRAWTYGRTHARR